MGWLGDLEMGRVRRVWGGQRRSQVDGVPTAGRGRNLGYRNGEMFPRVTVTSVTN